MSAEHRIRVSGLTKRFGKTCALNKVDWSLSKGSLVGLVGRNASGKTTLLHSVVGLLLPSEGSCRTLGVEAGALGEEQLMRIGFVDQDAKLLEWLTVEQHISYVAAFQPDWDASLATRLRREFELEDKKRISVLSKGMRQRLALLLAVCHHPDLLILDEPVSALDPVARQGALALILERVIDDGASVVVSSHVLHDVEKIVDRVLCLEGGHVVSDAALDDLKESFAEWIVSSPERDLPEQFSESFVLSREGNGRHVRLAVRATEEELASFRVRHGVEIERRSLDLERIFPLLTKSKS